MNPTTPSASKSAFTRVVALPLNDWQQPCTPDLRAQAIAELESGQVLFFPELSFAVEEQEKRLLSPQLLSGERKNISLDTTKQALHGQHQANADDEAVSRMMTRFAQSARHLLDNVLPHYSGNLITGRTSFRPVEVTGRASSWRKDDTRLHVDSFPATPVQGKRLLRVFSNINPAGKPRSWRVGEDFAHLAQHFVPSLSAPLPGSSALLRALHITKSTRSAYDHYMLQLHDSMKRDMGYQQSVAQTAVDFPAQTTWIVFTDQVSHAAMGGQHLLEQTFYLPVDAMQTPAQSPLHILQALVQRKLVA